MEIASTDTFIQPYTGTARRSDDQLWVHLLSKNKQHSRSQGISLTVLFGIATNVQHLIHFHASGLFLELFLIVSVFSLRCLMCDSACCHLTSWDVGLTRNEF